MRSYEVNRWKNSEQVQKRRVNQVGFVVRVQAVTTTRMIEIHFFFFYKCILFLAELGLCCCVRAFSSCGEWGLLFVAVCGLLIAVASLVAEHGL